MSILLVETVPQGIIFGADRNVSWSTETSHGEKTVIQNLGHTQRPKVLRWPCRKAIIGYVGAAQIAGAPTDEWLFDFIGRHLNFETIESVAEALRKEVEAQRKQDEVFNDPEFLLIHMAGFERQDGRARPVVWFVRNVHGINDGGYTDFRKELIKSEELGRAFKDLPAEQLRSHLQKMAEDFNPFWFHQGFDLGTFNTIETFLKLAFKALCEIHSDHSLPKRLAEWEAQVRMSILTYGAYFQAYGCNPPSAALDREGFRGCVVN